MQSNGGSISVDEARQAGVRCVLSGPAGGVVGAQFVGQAARQRFSDSANQRSNKAADFQPATSNLQLLTFDMGGTSTDVALIDGQPKVTTDAQVGGHPLGIPLLDIHTIGAGGGSLAYVDAGGALRVGPESAGADPGPACYGKMKSGLLATVTDANLVLGRILPDHFLGGKMKIYPALAQAALAKLGKQLGLSAIETALGIIEIANAHMERALRVISIERGHDPRQFTLFSFGGAGGLHATALARRMKIPQVLISPYAATFSAFGMLAADTIKDYTRTVMLAGDTDPQEIARRLDELLAQGRRDLRQEGFAPQEISLHPALDMRYRGQSFELTIPFGDGYLPQFHAAHQREYGYQRAATEIEIVNLRLQAVGQVPSPGLAEHPRGSQALQAALIATRPVIFPRGKRATPCYRGECLQHGQRITGPAVIVRRDTTILLDEGDQASVDAHHNLVIDINAGAEA